MGFQKVTEGACIYLGTSRAAYQGPALDLAPHLNIATTLAVGLEHPVQIRFRAPHRPWTDWTASPVVLIPSETLHHLRGQGQMLFLYLDPLSDCHRALTSDRLMQGWQALTARPDIGIQEVYTQLGVQSRPRPTGRLAQVLAALERAPQEFDHLQDAAAMACLSPSRFRARFKHEVGLPFRRYRLWRRMALVMRLLAQGHSLTQAAHDAGFAGSAHLSTTFKTMFGLTPSDLLSLRLPVIDEGGVPFSPLLSVMKGSQASNLSNHRG